MKNESLFVAIFTMAERSGWICPGLGKFLVSLSGHPSRKITAHISANVAPVDFARNEAAREYINSRSEWFLMIDADMSPPVNLLSMLDCADERMGVVVPMFYRASSLPDGRIATQLCWQFLRGPSNAEWQELAACGAGCMAVRSETFERMGNHPPFRFEYAADGAIKKSEDLYFCESARRAGASIWGNRRFVAEHFKTIELASVTRGVRVKGEALKQQ